MAAKAAALASLVAAAQERAAAPVFEYPAVGKAEGTAAQADGSDPPASGHGEEARALEARFAEAIAAAAAGERAHLTRAVEEFKRDRAEFFARVEGELVELALAIAGRILHRESQVDRRLLAGLARVAVEKIEQRTAVRLRVPRGDGPVWQEHLSAQTALPAVEVVEDETLGEGSCRLETELGTAELGLESQLKEVEQGLMDLLAARPGARS